MDTNSLIELFITVTTYPLSKVLKQLQLGSPGGSYGINEVMVVASFHHILDP